MRTRVALACRSDVMRDTTGRIAKWLIGIHSLIASFLAITRFVDSENGCDEPAAFCALVLTFAALLLAHRTSGVASSASRFGGLLMLRAYAAFSVRACGPG